MLTLWGLVMVVVLVLVAAGLAWLTRDTTPSPLPRRNRRAPRDPDDQPIVPDEEPPLDQP